MVPIFRGGFFFFSTKMSSCCLRFRIGFFKFFWSTSCQVFCVWVTFAGSSCLCAKIHDSSLVSVLYFDKVIQVSLWAIVKLIESEKKTFIFTPKRTNNISSTNVRRYFNPTIKWQWCSVSLHTTRMFSRIILSIVAKLI